MATSPRVVLLPRTIEIPASPRQIVLSQTPRQHYVSAAYPEETSPSRVPRISLNPRPVFKDVKNILPSTSQVPSMSRRPPTRWVSKQPETQLRPPSSKLRHSSSPTSTTSLVQPLTTRRASPTSPLAIPKREDASKLSTATIYGHVRSRHKMVPMVYPHLRIVSETPPPISSPTKNRQPPAARSLPASSSLIDSRSFDLLKDSIFYHGPSASLDSLATVGCLSDDRRQVYDKSRPTRDRGVYPSRTSSRHDGISKSTPQANYIRSPICPISPGLLLPPAPERPSKQPRRCPALTSPEAWRLPTESPPRSAGKIQDKFPSTSLLMKDDAVGFPVDMLDMLDTLEALATKVKILEMPERVQAKGNGCVRANDTREITMEYRDIPTDNGLAVDKVPLMFNRLEKGKWRCVRSDLQNCTDKGFSISASGSNRSHLKLPHSQGWNTHGYIYNPYNAPEFLAGCSTSPVLYRAYGYHSSITRQRPPRRKLSLPSCLAPPKPQSFAASLIYFCQLEQRTMSPSTLSTSISPSHSPQSPLRKPTTLKSLFHRSRPRSRSDVIPKLRASAMPISHHPVENIPVRGLPKPRFHWLKF